MPPALKTADLKWLLERLTQSYLTAESQYPDITQMTLLMGGSYLNIRIPAGRQWVLMLACHTLPLAASVEKQIRQLLKTCITVKETGPARGAGQMRT